MSTPFRRRNALHQWHLHFGPNMTPMVDVVMVILVFFMASTAFIGPEWLLRLGLAEDTAPVSAGFQLGPAEIVVRLSVMDGQVRVNGLGLADGRLEELESAAARAGASLGSAADQTRIILAPADMVPYDAVVRAQESLVIGGFVYTAIR